MAFVDANARGYHTLDGLRGIAAISIVILHTSHFFGGWKLPTSFLAVDLFFLLSGFVLASAYEDRLLSGMGVLEFARIRVVRLYPLYALGTVVGVPVALASMRLLPGLPMHWDLKLFAASLPLSLVMIPTPQLGQSDLIYPLNPVLWSIFFEVVVNLAYAAFARFLSNAVLLIIAGGSAASLVIYGAHAQTLDVGYGWATFSGGLLRVLFSFSLGIVLYRQFGRAPKIRTSVLSTFLVLAVPIAFAGPQSIVFELAVALLFFPVLIGLASRIEPRDGVLLSWFSAIGIASYAIYALHKPVYLILLGVLKIVMPFEPEVMAPWLGLAYIPILVLFCIWLDGFFDKPVRARLSQLSMRSAPAV